MLRILVLFIFTACSMGTIKTGGDKNYVYDTLGQYSRDDLVELAPKLVVTSKRDPRSGKVDELFGPKQRPLKRVGIIVFESKIQPTLGGLANDNLIFLSEAGKQLLTEKLLSVWEESLPILSPDVDYVRTSKVKKSKAFSQYGSAVENYVKTKREALAPDDIFYLEKNRKTITATILNPRGMRDVSFLLVPATELMGGPKWSEHNKHFVNDVAKELKLDAVIIVMSELSWTASHVDKYNGDFIPEDLTIKISASTLVPLTHYNERLEKIGIKDKADVTLCYRSYETELKAPILISVPPMDQKFETIEKELLSPMLKTYKDLAQMTIMRITEDLKKTW